MKRSGRIGLIIVLIVLICTISAVVERNTFPAEPSVVIEGFFERESPETVSMRTDINNIPYTKRLNNSGLIPHYVPGDAYYTFSVEKKLISHEYPNNANINPFWYPEVLYSFTGDVLYVDRLSFEYNDAYYRTFQVIVEDGDSYRFIMMNDDNRDGYYKVLNDTSVTGRNFLKDLLYCDENYEYGKSKDTDLAYGVLSDDGKTLFHFNWLGKLLKTEIFEKPVLISTLDRKIICFDGEKVFDYKNPEIFKILNVELSFDAEKSCFLRSDVIYCDSKLIKIDKKTLEVKAISHFNNIDFEQTKYGELINDEGVFFLNSETLETMKILDGEGWQYKGYNYSNIESGAKGSLYIRKIDGTTQLRVVVEYDGLINEIKLQDIKNPIENACITANSWARAYSPPKSTHRFHVSAFGGGYRYDYRSKWPVVDTWNGQYHR